MMNVEEKTLQLKQDIDDVYDAGYKLGQSSMIDESKIIEKTVSGEYISVDDVSEIPHEVKVKLTSGGKNLWKHGDVTVYRMSSYDVYLSAGKTYSFSVLATSTDTDSSYCLVYDATNDARIDAITKDARSCITFTPKKDIKTINLYASNGYANAEGDTATFKDIMLNEGTEGLPYEPYKETLTDYSGVSLTRCGANLVEFNKFNWNSGGVMALSNDDGTITVNGTATSLRQLMSYRMPFISNEKNVSFSLSDVSQSGIQGQIVLYGENDTVLYNRYFTSAETREIPKGCKSMLLNLYITQGTTVENFVFKPMVNFGSTALPYEPYNAQTLTANADGTVEGVTSTSPYMYMTTDNPNVTINAEYHKSYGMQTEYDRFWDVFQDKGNRTDYSTAFRGDYWKDEIFKPKYTIQPINAESMFIRTKITDIRMVDLTKATNVGNLCNSSTQGIRYVGKIGNSSIETFGSVFGWCHKLISVEKMIVDAKAQFNSAFEGCYDLESITFEGTIAYNISFAGSSKLNKASILSIFNALSTTATGKTLTLSTTAVNNAFETSTGAADGSTSTEWTNLVATKTNWTISLV